MRPSRHLFGLLALALTGCGVGSVSPLFSDADVTYDPRLVGTWRDSAAKESAVIAAADADAYTVTYTDSDGKTGRFRARLGTLGRFRVLELQPDKIPLEMSDAYKNLLLRLYAPLIIDSIGVELRFRLVEPDSLKAHLARQPRVIAHVVRREDELVVLTAPTASVRLFLATFLERRGVLSESEAGWRRVP